MLDEKIVRKVCLLFNKASNNPSEEEAQACLLMAQKLMVEHGISQSDVSGHDDMPTKNVVESKTNYERLAWWKKNIARVITENFRCHYYISRRYDKSCIVFLGLDKDVELAKITFEFACDAIKYGVKKFSKERKAELLDASSGVKNDYMRGWIQGLKDKFKEQVDKCNWGLVLVKDALVTQKYESMDLKKGRSTTIAISGSASARSAGYQDGKSFNSARGRISS